MTTLPFVRDWVTFSFAAYDLICIGGIGEWWNPSPTRGGQECATGNIDDQRRAIETVNRLPANSPILKSLLGDKILRRV